MLVQFQSLIVGVRSFGAVNFPEPLFLCSVLLGL
jgi:hypothetical protein